MKLYKIVSDNGNLYNTSLTLKESYEYVKNSGYTDLNILGINVKLEKCTK